MVVARDRTVETRESILDACDNLMERYGFRKTTMQDLAEEAGLSRRTIYLYFESKESVGLSSITRVVDSVYGEMAGAASGSGDLSGRLAEVLKIRVLSRLERVSRYANSLNELFEAVRPAYMELRHSWFERERGLIGELLMKGKETGEFDFDDALGTAEAMILATNAFIPYSLSPGEIGSPDQVRGRLDKMVGLLLVSVLANRPGKNI